MFLSAVLILDALDGCLPVSFPQIFLWGALYAISLQQKEKKICWTKTKMNKQEILHLIKLIANYWINELLVV